MTTIRTIAIGAGLIGALAGASSIASEPRCHDEHKYVVRDERNPATVIGIGYSCKKNGRSYGWLEPSNGAANVSSFFSLMGKQDSILYTAEKLSRDETSVMSTTKLTAWLYVDSARAEAEPEIPGIVATVTLKPETDSTWTMHSVVRAKIRWLGINQVIKNTHCTIHEGLRYDCSQSK
jgi:hypothetical protein